ncbi:hypothetical protein ACFE04_000505 [Oxalis oulophora]
MRLSIGFVVDSLKEPPLVTANTVLSILVIDYPIDKVSCYVSDDGAAMLTFEALSETSEFAKRWVPFAKKYSIEPRAPEWYFSQKIDYLKDKVQPSFVKDRRAIKRDYEEFKIRINGLVAKALKVPDEEFFSEMFKTSVRRDLVCIGSFQLTQKTSKMEYKASESLLQTINPQTGECKANDAPLFIRYE